MGGVEVTEEMIVALISAGGVVLGAGITALCSYLLYRRKHKDAGEDAKRDKADNTTKALRYLMLYVIQERAKELITHGKATAEERRSIHHWHDLYHNGLGGNGDADRLMEMVDNLPLDTEDRHD